MRVDNQTPGLLPVSLTMMVMVFFIVIPRLLLPPLLLRIGGDFGVDYGSASTLFLTASSGFVAGLLSSGLVAQRLTHRNTVTLAVAGSGVSLAVLAGLGNFRLFHLILFIGSWIGGLYPGSGVSILAELVKTRHRGKALAIHESGPNLAFIIAPLLAALVAPAGDWRGVFLIVGVASVGCAVVYARYAPASSSRGAPPTYATVRLLVRNRAFWVIAFLLTIAAIGAIGVYSVLPTFLIVEHGYNEGFVNAFIGVSRVTGFAAILGAGVAADRLGFAAVITVVMVTTGILTMLMGLSAGTVLLAAVFIQPMLVPAVFPVAMNGLTVVVPPKTRGIAVSLAIPLANLIGIGVVPRAMGAAGASGRFSAAFIVVGAIMVASVALLPLLRGSRLETIARTGGVRRQMRAAAALDTPRRRR